MNCPNCSTPAPAGGLFCTVCGTQLTPPLTFATPVGSPSSGYSPAPPLTSSTMPQTVYATWWRRVFGSLIDGIIVGVPTLILAVIVIARGQLHLGTAPANSGPFRCAYSNSTIVCPGGTTLHADFRTIIVGALLIRLVWSGYVILAVAGPRGATFGMRALKIRIVSASDESSQVTKGTSLLRYGAFVVVHYVYLVSPLFGFAGLLDSLWPLWDRRNQTLHDKMAATVALDVRK